MRGKAAIGHEANRHNLQHSQKRGDPSLIYVGGPKESPFRPSNHPRHHGIIAI